MLFSDSNCKFLLEFGTKGMFSSLPKQYTNDNAAQWDDFKDSSATLHLGDPSQATLAYMGSKHS